MVGSSKVALAVTAAFCAAVYFYGPVDRPVKFLPGDQVRVVAPIIGCDWSGYDKLGSLAMGQDMEAFSSYVASRVSDGRCTVISQGRSAWIEQVALADGATKLRQNGSVQSWWVTTELLNTSATKTGRGR